MNDEGRLLLLAEDEPLASMALRAQAEALGYTVAAVARDGAQALALARCLPADLALLDMKMPGMTGLDAATRFFPAAPTPVLLLTGYGSADLPDPLPRPPVFGVLTKPAGLNELRRALERTGEHFRTWLETEGDPELVRRSRQERRDIARAIQSLGDSLDAVAAARFLERADAAGAHPAELARRILQDAGA